MTYLEMIAHTKAHNPTYQQLVEQVKARETAAWAEGGHDYELRSLDFLNQCRFDDHACSALLADGIHVINRPYHQHLYWKHDAPLFEA